VEAVAGDLGPRILKSEERPLKSESLEDRLNFKLEDHLNLKLESR